MIWQMSLKALTREVSPAITRCELTHLAREPIDLDTARAQHEGYERALEALGCSVQRLPSGQDMPDSVFIEDVAIVLDAVAVITRPGAPSRRAECAVVEEALTAYRPIVRIEAPGTVDGGDVLVVGRSIFVGVSSRTNRDGIDQLRKHVAENDYSVRPVTVTGCLHLKSAATAVSDDQLLINRRWVQVQEFKKFDLIDVDPEEAYAANVVRVGDRLLYQNAFPRTRDRLQARGFDVTSVDVSELGKAEGAVTCCSLIFSVP
jgi:dimethylargininase